MNSLDRDFTYEGEIYLKGTPFSAIENETHRNGLIKRQAELLDKEDAFKPKSTPRVQRDASDEDLDIRVKRLSTMSRDELVELADAAGFAYPANASAKKLAKLIAEHEAAEEGTEDDAEDFFNTSSDEDEEDES